MSATAPTPARFPVSIRSLITDKLSVFNTATGLIGHGIAGTRPSAEGRCEREPIQSNTTAAGRFEDHRVELHVMGATPAQ